MSLPAPARVPNPRPTTRRTSSSSTTTCASARCSPASSARTAFASPRRLGRGGAPQARGDRLRSPRRRRDDAGRERDGIHRGLRKTSAVPILMLTARSETPHRIRGLEVGADDYLAKPFEPRELLLRITNILKRGSQPAAPVIEMIRFGPFTFHVERGELKKDGEVVHITDRERDILRIFAARPGETVRRHEFLKISNGGGRARGRRPDQPPSPQDRGGPRQPRLPADHARHRLPPAGGLRPRPDATPDSPPRPCSARSARICGCRPGCRLCGASARL